MTTITFDTRKAVRKLTAAGIAEAQADAVVDTVAEAFGENVATKADIADLKADMLKVAIGIVAAQVALTVTLVKLL